MLDILRQYFFGIIHYWWLLMFGLLGAANTAYKWFHPDRKDLPIPHWIRVYFAIGALLIAQFLLYRDSIKNLGAVILEKQSCNSDNWHLKERVNALSIAHSPAIPQVQSEGSAASAPHRNVGRGSKELDSPRVVARINPHHRRAMPRVHLSPLCRVKHFSRLLWKA